MSLTVVTWVSLVLSFAAIISGATAFGGMA